MPIHTETVKRVYVTCIIRSLHKWDRFLSGFGLGEEVGEKRGRTTILCETILMKKTKLVL